MKHSHILIADDDPDDLELVRDIIKTVNPNYEIIEANTGKEVLDYLHALTPPSKFPSLIIMDMNMPMLTGKEVLTKIKSKKELSSIPVVIFTTTVNEVDRQYCKSLGAEMITKPPFYNELIEVINKLLILYNPLVSKY